MSIVYENSKRIFHLKAGNTSYIIQVHKSGHIIHIYWGRKIRSVNSEKFLKIVDRVFSPNYDINDRNNSLDTLPREYPSYGNGDFRAPAYSVQLENGSTITNLLYEKYRIIKGKPKLDGLPALYAEDEEEAQTLEIELLDKVIGLKVILSYTVFERYNAITRSVRFINEGNEKLKLTRALSMSIDFNNSNYDYMHLPGAWARERHIERRDLASGIQAVESRRGASSHQNNPFLALLSKDTTEEHGEVFGFNFVYSGNFIAQAEVDQYKTTRVTMGINPFDFSWLLEQNEVFQTPEAVMVYSSNGIGDMSRTFHRLYRNNLCRGKYKYKSRPVLINNWEATYFDFNAERIENIAKAAKELGIELFVLDDGWFGRRDDDTSSLGDWFVNKKKLPRGLKDLAERVNKIGLQFGLWFEPEMVSPNSDLYRSHPGWCLHVPNRQRSLGRNQLVLDLSRKEVCDEIIKMVSDILSNAPISYVKWDMNRHMTEIGSAALPSERQRETAHRYMLGLYRIMEEITSAFPNILFESCSGGGGRFDPGILYYMPQTWTSDDTDGVERLFIQYGTSIVYPSCTMGAHVSAIPNHQVHRNTPLKFRGDVAMSGNFGYELDVAKFSKVEQEIVRGQIALCKEIRQLVQFGDMYRLMSPFEGNDAAWMFVSEDRTEAITFFFRILAKPNAPLTWIKLKGLDETRDYRLIGSEEVYGGDELMHAGLYVPELYGDYQSMVWRLRSI